jgi:hypothetical protein
VTEPLQMEPIVKSQPIRLLDILVIGPLMMVGGVLLAKNKNKLVGVPLVFFGMTTVWYNLSNYVKVRKLETQA